MCDQSYCILDQTTFSVDEGELLMCSVLSSASHLTWCPKTQSYSQAGKIGTGEMDHKMDG